MSFFCTNAVFKRTCAARVSGGSDSPVSPDKDCPTLMAAWERPDVEKGYSTSLVVLVGHCPAITSFSKEWTNAHPPGRFTRQGRLDLDLRTAHRPFVVPYIHRGSYDLWRSQRRNYSRWCKHIRQPQPRSGRTQIPQREFQSTNQWRTSYL